MKYIDKTTFLTVAILFECVDLLQSQEQKSWQWVSQIGGRSWDMTSGLACDSKNNLYVTGSYFDTLYCNDEKIQSAGDQDIFIARFDEKGNINKLWSVGGKGRDQVTCILAARDNGIIVGGLINNNVAFDSQYSNADGNQLFLANLGEKGKFTWLSTFTPTGDAALLFLGTEGNGKIVAAGIFTDSLTADSTTVISIGRKDIFIARLNATGTVEKLVSFGGEEDDFPTALSVSDSGIIVLAGSVGKSFIVNDLVLNISNSNAKSNAFILRFDDNLKALSKMQIACEEFGHIASVKQDAHGSIYAAGSFNHNIWLEDTLTSKGYSDIFLLKYGSNGSLMWGREFGTWYYDYAVHLLIDNLGGTIITGSLGDTLFIDDLQVNPLSGNNSALAIQFTTDGRATWADCISGNGRNFSGGAVIDRKGNLYLTGTFQGMFRKESNSLTSLGDQDVFLARYFNCPEGESEINGHSVICPGKSTLLTVKQEYKNVVWNDTIADQNYILAEKPGEYQVTMVDKKGCVLSDTLEVTLDDLSYFSLGNDLSIQVEQEFELRAPENFTKYRWQDNSEDPTFIVRSENGKPGTYTYWLTAMDSLGCDVCDTISVEFYLSTGWFDPMQVQLIVYPNPVEDWLYWSLNTDKTCQLIVELTDCNGKIILNQYIGQYLPGTTMKIDFSDFPAGSYFLRLKKVSGQISDNVCIIRQ